MDAVQRKAYAKYRSNRTPGRRRPAPAAYDLREVVLLQCIVSAFILILAMGLIFIKAPQVQEMRVSVKRALSEETTAEGIMQMTEDAANKYNNLKNSIQGIFGGEPEVKQVEEPVATAPPVAAPPVTETASQEIAEPTDFRIDEDVLKDIDSSLSFYYESGQGEGAEKKPEVPAE